MRQNFTQICVNEISQFLEGHVSLRNQEEFYSLVGFRGHGEFVLKIWNESEKYLWLLTVRCLEYFSLNFTKTWDNIFDLHSDETFIQHGFITLFERIVLKIESNIVHQPSTWISHGEYYLWSPYLVPRKTNRHFLNLYIRLSNEQKCFAGYLSRLGNQNEN
jgi:hypothetical protein